MTWRTIIVCLAALVLVGVVMRSGGRAAVPSAFDPAVTLAQATAAASAAQQPVLVFATADWCGPCQEFKRGALTDPRVNEWIRANTRPVYLDVDRSRDEAIELGITAIPALVMLRDGKIIDRHDGGMETQQLVDWLMKPR